MVRSGTTELQQKREARDRWGCSSRSVKLLKIQLHPGVSINGNADAKAADRNNGKTGVRLANRGLCKRRFNVLSRVDFKKQTMRLAIWCLLFAIVCAPLATSLQMIENSFAAEGSDAALMPCHGKANSSGTDSSSKSAMALCACTPWCHAALSPAFDFAFFDSVFDLPPPVAQLAAAKTANASPPLKPPII